MNSISVCMATYNGERYIRQQLLSILTQLAEGDEVIISDDGSTDKTLDIIADFTDQRIRVSKNLGQTGPLGNFQQAISLATGNFILLSDQDDIWHSTKVEDMRQLLQDYDLVLSDCQVVDENGVVIHKSFFKYRGSKPGFWNNLLKNSYIGCCMAFRQEITHYILPFPPQVHMHDWWIGLLVETKGIVYFYPKPLIQYVRHGKNASPTGEGGYSLTNKLLNRLFLLLYVIKRVSRLN